MKLFTSVVLAAVTASSIVFAGPQYLDETGFAASGHDVVAYFSLKQNPVGQQQPAAVAGDASITAEYNGATWAFSSEANRDAFTKNPEAYIPQYNGHCAYGVAQGGKVPANPQLWRIVDGKLYFNVTQDVVGFWEKNIPGNLKKSESKWTKIEPRKASTRTIPFYSSAAPIQN